MPPPARASLQGPLLAEQVAYWSAELAGAPPVLELGGDSIVSIQIIARAHQAGLQLTPKQLFQHQTIAHLAASVAHDAVAADGTQEPLENPQSREGYGSERP